MTRAQFVSTTGMPAAALDDYAAMNAAWRNIDAESMKPPSQNRTERLRALHKVAKAKAARWGRWVLRHGGVR